MVVTLYFIVHVCTRRGKFDARILGTKRSLEAWPGNVPNAAIQGGRGGRLSCGACAGVAVQEY